MSHGGFGIEAEGAVALEQRQRLLQLHPLDGQKPGFRGQAAIGGEAARLPARRQDAVAGHHDGEGIAAERLAHRAGGARRADLRGHLAIRPGRTRRYGSRGLVDPPVELRHAVHLQRDTREVGGLALQQRHDGVQRLADPRRWRDFRRAGELARQPGARVGGA